MREHCRTQHKYDPFPNVAGSARFKTTYKRDKLSGVESDKFRNMMNELLKIQDLARGYLASQGIIDSIKSIDLALDFMLQNFVIVPKRQIRGISGHICSICLTFQFHYVRDIGFDLTATERHRCAVRAVTQANSLQDRSLRLSQIYSESIRWLISSTKSIFEPSRYLTVDPLSSPTGNFHSPQITMDSIASTHWAWTPIQLGIVALTDEGLEQFVKEVGGTYVVVSIRTGTYAGTYLIRVSRNKPLAQAS
jgi:hypothetical protein